MSITESAVCTTNSDAARQRKPLPGGAEAFGQAALIDAKTCAAGGQLSVSWWHEEVRAGRAPAPVVRLPRCTRWRLSQVSAFWADFATRAQADTRAAELVTAKARLASAKAREPAAVEKAQATRRARIAARQGVIV